MTSVADLRLRGGEAGDPQRAGDEVPVQSLASALAAGHAYFAGSPIRAVGPGSTRGIRRLSAKAGAIFGGFPEVAVTDYGVEHTTGHLPFTEARLGGASYLLGCGTIPGRPLSPGTPVEVVTGMCLFGAGSVLGWTGPDAYSMVVGPIVAWNPARRIEAVTTDTRWHVYEAETLSRLGSFIRALNSLDGQARVRVNAHIPGPEYELYGLSLYAHGLLPADLCDRYRRAVRDRAALLGSMLRDCLGDVAEVTASSPLDFVSRLPTGAWPPARILGRLYGAASQQDGLWKDLLAGKNLSFRTLINASYVYRYLAAAADARQRGHQMLLAENPDEELIFRHAAREAARSGISLDAVTGFYVHPQVVVTQTEFSGAPRILHECRNGCDPATIAAATDYYTRDGFPLPADPAAWPPSGQDAGEDLLAACAGSHSPGTATAVETARHSPRIAGNRVQA